MKLQKIFEKVQLPKAKSKQELEALKAPEPPVYSDYFKTREREWEIECENYRMEMQGYRDRCAALESISRAEANGKAPHLDVNTLIAAGVEIGGLLLILNYEQFNAITSKAFSRLPKIRR